MPQLILLFRADTGRVVNPDDAGRGGEEIERGRVDSGMVMNFPCQLRKRIPNADKSFSVDATSD